MTCLLWNNDDKLYWRFLNGFDKGKNVVERLLAPVINILCNPQITKLWTTLISTKSEKGGQNNLSDKSVAGGMGVLVGRAINSLGD